MTERRIIRKSSFRWVGYAYCAFGVVAFSLLINQPAKWMAIIMLSLGVAACAYFLASQTSHQLWIEGRALKWRSRFSDCDLSGEAAIDDIRFVHMCRQPAASESDLVLTRVVLSMHNGDMKALPATLQLGVRKDDMIKDVMDALRNVNSRIMLKLENQLFDTLLTSKNETNSPVIAPMIAEIESRLNVNSTDQSPLDADVAKGATASNGQNDREVG